MTTRPSITALPPTTDRRLGWSAWWCLVLGVSTATANPNPSTESVAHGAAASPGHAPAAAPPDADRDGPADSASTSATAAELDAPRPGRAALAMGAMLALGTAWYWAYRGDNAVDWDDPDLGARVSGEAWRMDNNGLALNFLAHPLSGTAFYAVARSQHLSVPTSALYSFLTSFAWEYIVEFREKVSINDVIVTPGAGIAMGEFFHKLALYVNSSTTPPTGFKNFARIVTGPTVALTRWLDDDTRLGAPPPDDLGFSPRIHHDFRFHYAFMRGDENTAVPLDRHEVGFRGKLVAIPGYGAPGSFDRTLTDADITELSVAVSHSPSGNGLEVFADTLLVGHYSQNISDADNGASATVGSSIAYHFLDSHAAGVPERRGVFHFPGVAAETQLSWRGLRAELWARAHADFAGIGSLAYPLWRDSFPDERPKAILLKEGYYYGLGGTGRVRASLGWGPLELRSSFEAAYYDSVEGLDRAKELVAVDVEATDLFRNTSFDLVLEPLAGLAISFGVNERVNLAKVQGFRETTKVLERGVAVTLGF